MQRHSVTGSSSSWVCADYAQPFATSGFIQEKVFSPGTPYLVVKERANTDVIQWIWKQPFWKEMLAIPPPAKAGGTLARKHHGVEMSIIGAARKYNIPHSTLSLRLSRGMSIEEAIKDHKDQNTFS